MYEKTILFLNLRFADFYSKDLLQKIKSKYESRIVAILDQQFQNKIPAHIEPYLDKTYLLNSKSKDGFLAEFDIDQLKPIVETELNTTNDLRIVCSDEFNLINAGKLRHLYGLSGHNDTDLLPYRNKLKMKELLQKQNIRVPKFKKIKTTDIYSEIVSETGTPFIIKPVDSCGSHGISLIKDQLDYKHFEMNFSDYTGEFEAEEFIEGTLYHVDSLIKDNQLKFICANEYSIPNFEYTKGKVLSSIPLEPNTPIANRLIEFTKKCLNALSANNLINHMELFINKNDEIIFLEVSARPPGALLNLTHKINFGVNLMDEDFFMQTGCEINLNSAPVKENAFYALFPLKPGKISKLIKPDTLSQCEMTWFVKEGDEIKSQDCQNIVRKAAHAIIRNSDMSKLLKDFHTIKHHQAIEVINNE